jgi:LEA14-like dessication related protein
MSILTKMISDSKFKIQHSTSLTETIRHSSFVIRHFPMLLLLAWITVATGSCKPKEDVQLRKIKDIIVDVTTDPMLRANAVLYNPNSIRMTVKRINIEITVDGKKAGLIDQELKTKVPARAEFSIPLEVKLNLKELGFMDTVFAFIGGKKMQINYKGSIRLQYKGVPINVPVNYTEEVRVRL